MRVVVTNAVLLVVVCAVSCDSGRSPSIEPVNPGIPIVDNSKVSEFLSVEIPEGQAAGLETAFAFSVAAIKDAGGKIPVMHVEGSRRTKGTYLLGSAPPKPMAVGSTRTVRCPFTTTQGMRLVIDLIPPEEAQSLRPLD